MNRSDLLDAIAAAEKAIEEAGVWRVTPDGLERVEEKPIVRCEAVTRAPRWTGKPRKGSKQWRKKYGGVV